jgi:hypothetical protein
MSDPKTTPTLHAELIEAIHRLDELESLCRARPDAADPTEMLEALGEVYRASRELVRDEK